MNTPTCLVVDVTPATVLCVPVSGSSFDMLMATTAMHRSKVHRDHSTAARLEAHGKSGLGASIQQDMLGEQPQLERRNLARLALQPTTSTSAHHLFTQIPASSSVLTNHHHHQIPCYRRPRRDLQRHIHTTLS